MDIIDLNHRLAERPFIIVTEKNSSNHWRRRMVLIHEILSLRGADTTESLADAHEIPAELQLLWLDADGEQEQEGITVAESVNEIASLIATAKRDGVGFRRC